MIRATARSAATPDRLWSLASDVERWGDRLPTVDSVRPLGSGPTGVGSRFEVRQPGLPKAVWEVTDWQPQARSFTWVSTSPGIRSTAVHAVQRRRRRIEAGPVAGVVRTPGPGPRTAHRAQGPGHGRDRGRDLRATCRAGLTGPAGLRRRFHPIREDAGRRESAWASDPVSEGERRVACSVASATGAAAHRGRDGGGSCPSWSCCCGCSSAAPSDPSPAGCRRCSRTTTPRSCRRAPSPRGCSTSSCGSPGRSPCPRSWCSSVPEA